MQTLSWAKGFSLPLLGLIFGFGLGCAASPPTLPAQGHLAEQWVETSVDSPLAQAYLAWGREGLTLWDQEEKKAEMKLNLKPQKVYQLREALKEADQESLSSESLQRLSREFSTDVATLYFAERVLQEPQNRQAHKLFRQKLSRLRQKSPLDSDQRQKINENFGTWRFLFVPGFHYAKEPHTGADFAQTRSFLTSLGLKAQLIPIQEDGRVQHNAQQIVSFLRNDPSESPLVLVSTSKGGPETLVALEILSQSPLKEDAEILQRVVAWVSLGGLLRGTPLSEMLFSWPQRPLSQVIMRLQGTRTAGLVDLLPRRRKRQVKKMDLNLLPLTVHYVATPLSGQVSSWARDRYLRMRTRGPNDGLTLLADSILPRQVVILAPGMDHFYRSPDIDNKALALIQVLPELELKRTSSPTEPELDQKED